jgi:hypothetical protein
LISAIPLNHGSAASDNGPEYLVLVAKRYEVSNPARVVTFGWQKKDQNFFSASGSLQLPGWSQWPRVTV